MKESIIFSIIVILIFFTSCNKKETAVDILTNTINTIDTIETIYYKQDMLRTNPQNTNEDIQRYREMYFKRLISDSIVGVKGHWYMYINDKENIIYEDIYDGNKLLRKNNPDSAVLIYDLIKYPEFKNKNFWAHNTIYGMQYEFKYILNNLDSYSIKRLNDTIIDKKDCYRIEVKLEDKITMPGFKTKLIEDIGSVSKSIYFINKKNYFPIQIKAESYSIDNPNQIYFINQKYYDIKFNLLINEDIQFNTSLESVKEYEIIEMRLNNLVYLIKI